MARTALPLITPLGSYPTLPISANAADFVFTASDHTNGNSFVSTGRELVLVQNSDSGAQTVTFTSIVDQYNRTGNITAYSLGAGEFGIFGPFQVTGWRQSSGVVFVDSSDNAIKVAVVILPFTS